jgi:signal transduction histidine kinase
VQLTCRPRGSQTAPAQLLLTTIIDVTEQRRLEAEHEQARGQHAELVRQMLSILEAERQRLARDIHDDLGQQVTGLRLKLDWLASLVAKDETLRAPVSIVQTAAAVVDRHIDYLLRQMRPAGLDELGLVAALQGAVQQWSQTFGVKAEFRSLGTARRHSPDTETHLYRIVQEALNNVHKHAAARSVMVRLERRPADSVLTVADDGNGFDLRENGSGSRRGLGLLGMRERATLIGGEMTVHSQPGRGTTIVVRLNAC